MKKISFGSNSDTIFTLVIALVKFNCPLAYMHVGSNANVYTFIPNGDFPGKKFI